MKTTRSLLSLLLPALALMLFPASAPAAQALARGLVPQDSIRSVSAGATDGAASFGLTVDLSERMLYVLRGDEVVKEYPVAIGKPAHPTPRGEFSVGRIIWNPRWVPPTARWARGKRPREAGDPRNPMGRVKMFFRQPDYYIHGTNDEDSLGEAESHGCIRMRNDDIIELARMVMENGGERREPGWFQRVINRVRHTQDVRLSKPVTFKVRA
jgi:lipoprotein-anchoring transpeptidase ErfK/SrfK